MIFERNIKIEFVPLEKVYSIVKRKTKPAIEACFIRTPLNIHPPVHDFDSRKVLGDVGAKSLIERRIKIRDLEMAEDAARLYPTTINEMIRKKAEELGF